MGAGDYGAGLGGAGFDPVLPASSPITDAAPPLAVYFDLATKTYLSNADGTLKGMHPVDQRVVLALGIEAGSLTGVPSQGHRFRSRLSRVPPATIPRIALDETRLALKNLLLAKDILLLAVETDTTVRGRVLIAVTYVNMRDPATNIRNPNLSARKLNVVA